MTLFCCDLTCTASFPPVPATTPAARFTVSGSDGLHVESRQLRRNDMEKEAFNGAAIAGLLVIRAPQQMYGKTLLQVPAETESGISAHSR